MESHPEPAAPSAKTAFGSNAFVAEPLERVAVRWRESGVTASAWRLKVSSDQGQGTIVMLDLSDRSSCFRGDGIFLGWSQARLADAYQELTRALSAGDSDLELLQLG